MNRTQALTAMAKRPWIIALCIAAGLTAVWWLTRLPAVPDTGHDVLTALRSVTIPIATDDPASDDRDLDLVLPLLAHRRVVALGEATHGTREFFRLKDRLFRLLVRRAAFTTFALEISPEAGERMNRYVRDGAGTVDDALKGFEFWTWQTDEVRELASWMRTWNAGLAESRRLSFIGVNATGGERDRRMAANLSAALAAAGPDGRIVVWAHNAHVSYGSGWMGSYLREQLGDSMYVVGFEFSEGTFRSRNLFGVRNTRYQRPVPRTMASRWRGCRHVWCSSISWLRADIRWWPDGSRPRGDRERSTSSST
jgi:erythromycin esterase-like protein